MNRPLRIGILRSDGVVKPVASIERALQHVIRKLSQSADIELVDYTPMDGTLAWNLIVGHGVKQAESFRASCTGPTRARWFMTTALRAGNPSCR